jgi:hypothetical protein
LEQKEKMRRFIFPFEARPQNCSLWITVMVLGEKPLQPQR